MIQQAIVAVIVALAAWAVARRYLPKPVRRRGAALAGRALRRLGWTRLAAWAESDVPATASCGSGCGTCGQCGAGADANQEAVQAQTMHGADNAGALASKATPKAGAGAQPDEYALSVNALKGTIRRKNG